MREPARTWLLVTGKVMVVSLLALTGIAALLRGRPAWTNYWGGWVFPPAAILIAVLLIWSEIKPARRSGRRRQKRSRSN